MRNMVIREVVQMIEQPQDELHQTALELETVSESSAPTATPNTPPRSEHRATPPESVAACLPIPALSHIWPMR